MIDHLACSTKWCIAVCGESGKDEIIVFDPETGREVHNFTSDLGIIDLKIYENRLIAANNLGSYRIWDLTTGLQIADNFSNRCGCATSFIYMNGKIVSFTNCRNPSELRVIPAEKGDSHYVFHELMGFASAIADYGNTVAITFKDRRGITLFNLNTCEQQYFDLPLPPRGRSIDYQKDRLFFDSYLLYFFRDDGLVAKIDFSQATLKKKF